MAASHHPIASWLVPSLISGVVSVAALTQGYLVATASQRGTERLEVSKLRMRIVESVNQYDFHTAQVLLAHGLRPIDGSESFEAFSNEILELAASRAPEAPSNQLPSANGFLGPSSGNVAAMGNAVALTELFRGAERLAASNRLLELYPENSDAVVEALRAAILPDGDPASYRVNLYIAYTIARISQPKCTGPMNSLVNRVAKLRTTSSYRDATFRRRVDEAVTTCE